MGLKISWTIDGEKQVSVELGIAAEGVTDFHEPLTRIATDLLKTFDLNFESRGSLLQPPGWAPRKKAQPWPLLEKTGRMRGGFRSKVSSSEAVLTNVAPYFPYHQRGTGRLPRRILMKIDEARRNFIIRAFQEYLVRLARGRR